MGWFGPTIHERSRGGRIEYYGKCEECRNEHADMDRKRAVRKLEDCAKKDKKEKAQKKASEAKEAAEKARKQDEAKKEREEEARQAALDKLKKQRMRKAREMRRNARGKCPFCGKEPCAGTRPNCAAIKAAAYESSMDIDVSDPATFNKQLKFYRDNM